MLHPVHEFREGFYLSKNKVELPEDIDAPASKLGLG
jgi:hypothetical protein